MKKSSAMRKTLEFFGAMDIRRPHFNYGVGSAEGLVRSLRAHPNLILAYDELRSFVDKTRVQGSVLLPMVTSLFEGNDWENAASGRADQASSRARAAGLDRGNLDVHQRVLHSVDAAFEAHDA